MADERMRPTAQIDAPPRLRWTRGDYGGRNTGL